MAAIFVSASMYWYAECQAILYRNNDDTLPVESNIIVDGNHWNKNVT